MLNKKRYVMKQIGWIIVLVSIFYSIPVHIFVLLGMYRYVFIYGIFIAIISVVLQVVGWNEPLWFENKNDDAGKKH